MPEDFKGYDFLNDLFSKNPEFKEKVQYYMKNGKIRFFSEQEWDKIQKQNYISTIPGVTNFYDIFKLGYNVGDCVGVSWQLSYSYDDVDIVSGTVPILKGTLNAEKEGGHRWLENQKYIIDTSLLLVIDKDLKGELGYKE